MKKSTKRARDYTIPLIVAIMIFGVAFRLIAASFGFTYDLESYALVGHIVNSGGNVYAETTRYNYGPVWMYIIGGMYKLSLFFPHSFIVFRFGIAFLLSLVDIGIFVILWKQYSLRAGLLYYLNPLTLVLTGYNSHFDNLAILIALCAVLVYRKNKKSGLALLGLSLVTKHIFFMFPFWIAVAEKRWRDKLLALALPFGIFILSFTPFVREAMTGIVNNVFFYVSFKNAPLWNTLILNGFPRALNQYMVFGGALLMGALVFRKKPLIDSLLFYALLLVTFSVSIADQYFSIVLPFIAVFPNAFFFVFTLVQMLYMWVVMSGGEVYASFLGRTLDRSAIGYNWQLILLLIGFIYVLFRKHVASWNKKHWIRFLVALNLLFIFLIALPNYLENKRVTAIERALQRGEYELANMLYSSIEKEAPLAGSRFWNKLTRVRFYIEQYRKETYENSR